MTGRKQYKMRAALIAALIAALALAGLAYAAKTSGLLDSIFQGKQPTEEAAALLTTSEASVTDNGVTLTLNEYLLDGDTLHLSWTMTTQADEALLCASGFPAINGVSASSGSYLGEVGMYTFAMLTKDEPAHFQMMMQLSNPPVPGEEYEISLTGCALRPLDNISGLKTPRGNYDLWSSEASLLLSRDSSKNVYDILAQLGVTQTVAVPVLTVTAVTPETSRVGAEALSYEFDEYTLKIIRMEFGATSTLAELHIYPKRAFMEYGADMKNADPLISRIYRLQDENGRCVTDGVYGGWEGGVMGDGEEDGETEHYCWLGDWGPIDPPDTVILMPYLRSDGLETPLTEEAVTVYIR